MSTDTNVAPDGGDADRLMAALQLDAGEGHELGGQLDEGVQVETDEEKAELAARAEAEADADKAAAAQAPVEDEVEIAGEDGAEPTRIKVSELLESHRAYAAFKGQEAQTLERVEREVVEAASGRLRTIEQAGEQMAYMLQGAMQLLQRPQPPNADVLLNPQSQQYDPDRYHRDFAKWQQGVGQFDQAQALGRELLQRATAARAEAASQREGAELTKALRVWPDFGKTEVQQKFISDMTAAYGYSPQELDASLNDHRNLQVARDALAYRAMKASANGVKTKVETAAPKLVRSKTEAKAAGAQSRDAGGRFMDDAQSARDRLSKSHSDTDAIAAFVALGRAGRV